MTALILWFEADGITPASRMDWGYVRPGQSGDDKTYIFRNTGDTPATNCTLSILPIGTADLEDWLTGTYAGDQFTAADPLEIGTVAAGESGTIAVSLAVPPTAPLDSRPVMAQLGMAFDLED